MLQDSRLSNVVLLFFSEDVLLLLQLFLFLLFLLHRFPLSPSLFFL